jgi:hypothetical protein
MMSSWSSSARTSRAGGAEILGGARSRAIFSRGYTARTVRGRVHEVATDVPVTAGDVVVSARDYALPGS